MYPIFFPATPALVTLADNPKIRAQRDDRFCDSPTHRRAAHRSDSDGDRLSGWKRQNGATHVPWRCPRCPAGRRGSRARTLSQISTRGPAPCFLAPSRRFSEGPARVASSRRQPETNTGAPEGGVGALESAVHQPDTFVSSATAHGFLNELLAPTFEEIIMTILRYEPLGALRRSAAWSSSMAPSTTC